MVAAFLSFAAMPGVRAQGVAPGPAQAVRLTLLDVMGREVSRVVDRVDEPGQYDVEVSGTGLSPGMYFYRLEIGNFSATRKLVKLR